MKRLRILTRGQATADDLKRALDQLGVAPGEQFVIARQATLLDGTAHARRSDPETSKAAAASIDPEKLRESQEAVLSVLRGFPAGLVDEELVAAFESGSYGDLTGGSVQSPSGLRTRRAELVEAGARDRLR